MIENKLINNFCFEDKRLITIIRAIKFGEIKIKLRDGKPILIEKGIKTILLTNGKEENDRSSQ